MHHGDECNNDSRRCIMAQVCVNYSYRLKGGNGVASTTIVLYTNDLSHSSLIRLIESQRPHHEVIKILTPREG